MGVTTVDLLYLHNPAESQLAQVGQQAFMQVLPCPSLRLGHGSFSYQQLAAQPCRV